MVPADFVMHWAEDVPRVRTADGLAEATVFAGQLMGKKGLPPPRNSWAADPASAVAVYFLELKPGGSIELEAAAGGADVSRRLYVVEGPGLDVGGRQVPAAHHVDLAPDVRVAVSNASASEEVHALVLQGRPIGEPVEQHGPFVMNTRQEIMQAFHDYQRTKFGGWPWDEDAVVFERAKGRFALVDGKEFRPPNNPTGAVHHRDATA